MDDDKYIDLIRSIEVEKGRMTTHEEVCAERYRGIASKMADLQSALDKVVSAVTAGDGRVAKWRDKILYAVIAVLFAAASWEGGQLWQHDVSHQTSALTRGE